jgi:hypothetical protein
LNIPAAVYGELRKSFATIQAAKAHKLQASGVIRAERRTPNRKSEPPSAASALAQSSGEAAADPAAVTTRPERNKGAARAPL